MAHRFSGHETFPFRYAWLPKACQGILRKPGIFADEDASMVEFGVGKNMVRAMRFWVEAAGLAKVASARQLEITPLGIEVFGPNGLDPYMEDIQTLWLLHWNISTQVDSPLFAWEFLLNRWGESEIKPESVVQAFAHEAERLAQKTLSPVTLRQHFDVFIHTYLPTRGQKGELADDNLDCPLTALDLIVLVGESESKAKRREPVYAFRREEKSSIGVELFTWALWDFWQKRSATNKTLPARSVAFDLGSPGQTFKIPEQDVIRRLGDLESVTGGALIFHDSHSEPYVERTRNFDSFDLLRAGYKAKVHA